MTKTTPGPWKYDGDYDPIIIWGDMDSSSRQPLIAKLDFTDENVDEQIANALLIAAAPELLTSLRALVDWARQHTSPVQPNSPHAILVEAWKALDRAEGRAE